MKRRSDERPLGGEPGPARAAATIATSADDELLDELFAERWSSLRQGTEAIEPPLGLVARVMARVEAEPPLSPWSQALLLLSRRAVAGSFLCAVAGVLLTLMAQASGAGVTALAIELLLTVHP